MSSARHCSTPFPIDHGRFPRTYHAAQGVCVGVGVPYTHTPHTAITHAVPVLWLIAVCSVQTRLKALKGLHHTRTAFQPSWLCSVIAACWREQKEQAQNVCLILVCWHNSVQFKCFETIRVTSFNGCCMCCSLDLSTKMSKMIRMGGTISSSNTNVTLCSWAINVAPYYAQR